MLGKFLFKSFKPLKTFSHSSSFSHSSLSKVCKSIDEALEGLKSGDKILVGGFGICGIPENILRHIAAAKDTYKNFWAVSCSCGNELSLYFFIKIFRILFFQI